MKAFFSSLILLALALPALAGGGWPQPRHHGYLKLGQSMIRADQFFTPDGSLADITTTSVYQTSLYGEYGITDRLTAVFYTPFFVRSTINRRESTVDGVVVPGDDFQGFGDLDIGLKYGILTQGPVVLSATLTLGLPTGQNVGGNTELLQTGDGEFNQMLMLEGSRSFYPAPFYATLAVGYNNRGTADFDYSGGSVEAAYSDEFRWGGELGWTPGDRWILALKWQHVLPLGNGTEGLETGSASVFSNNAEYLSITPEVNYRLTDRWGVSAAVGTAAYGKNILASPNFQTGVFFQW